MDFRHIPWPNARDWIGISVFALTVMLLWMMKGDPMLMDNEFFKIIATLIIGTGFVNGPVAWAYSTTKTGGELAESNARIVKEAVPAALDPGSTQKVDVVNTRANPVNISSADAGAATAAPTDEDSAPWNNHS